MGFNFRKSIKIGKLLRINLSKSGVGWSIGGKGIRYTRAANGSTRTTLSLPGTGLSYTIPGKSADSKQKKERQKALEKAVQSFDGTVYFSGGGKCYHIMENCGGHTFTRTASLEQAEGWGLSPCSKCAAKIKTEPLSSDN